ncbi:hypothetical protein CASFOL_038557 [Castilleja foliolosa]|uniref:Uncharacterized protein n=1 Tax=Castilleja foliolosa TaxID=1961234 RepID=A0ABD3BMJ9_9LAMI
MEWLFRSDLLAINRFEKFAVWCLDEHQTILGGEFGSKEMGKRVDSTEALIGPDRVDPHLARGTQLRRYSPLSTKYKSVRWSARFLDFN